MFFFCRFDVLIDHSFDFTSGVTFSRLTSRFWRDLNSSHSEIKPVDKTNLIGYHKALGQR